MPRKYFAFLSYSHADLPSATAVARFIETFRVPVRLGGKETANFPKRMYPVFRDRDELSGSSDLGEVIRKALQESGALVVLCSPSAARSRWVNEEIREFRKLGNPERIFTVLLSGDPAESFPSALTEGGLEPLAIDFRPHTDKPRDARLRLASALLSVDFEALKRRDATRRRNAAIRWSAALVLTVAAAVAAFTSIYNQRQTEMADRLSDTTLQRPMTDVAGMVLATEAYGIAATPRTVGAVLQHVLGLGAFRTAVTPDWIHGAVADHGSLFAALTSSSNGQTSGGSGLFVARLLDLSHVASTNLPFDPLFLCGFPDRARIAVGNATLIRTYDISNQSIKEAWSARMSGVDAIACAPHSTDIIAATRDGAIRRTGVGNRVSVFGVLPGIRVSAIAVSPSGRYAATLAQRADGLGDIAAGQIDIFDTIARTHAGVLATALPGAWCVAPAVRMQRYGFPAPSCAGSMAFSRDERSFAWISAGVPFVETVSLGDLHNVKRLRCEPCAFDALPGSGILLYGSGKAAP